MTSVSPKTSTRTMRKMGEGTPRPKYQRIKSALDSRMRTLLVAVLAGVTLSAQTRTPGFEVAAIRENTGGGTGGGTRFQDGGRWNATNMPLASLITVAFGLNDSDRVLNVPAWARATR